MLRRAWQRKVSHVFFSTTLCVFLTGCATYSARVGKLQNLMTKGDYEEALALVEKETA